MHCRFCNKDFEERKQFPGVDVCELCDSMGKAGILERGGVRVCFATTKRGR